VAYRPAMSGSTRTRRFPDGFRWGTATAAHQIEGGNWNSDWWAWEHDPGSAASAPSGDACDSWHRFADDIAIVADLGLSDYRFSVEWARIEPEEGEFSNAALEHYRRVCAACLEAGVAPVATFHHFTLPRWVAAAGGWADAATVDRFRRYCERTAGHLGDLLAAACTINEPNVVATLGYALGDFPPGLQDFDAWGSATDHLVAAHHAAVDVLKAAPGDFPVGITISMADWAATPGAEDACDRSRQVMEGAWCEAARDDDFVGVQAYTRIRVDEHGLPTAPEPGVEVLPMGYEYWPQALAAAVRYAADVARVPVWVTENGIGTDDDDQRVRYLEESLGGLLDCIDAGIDVRAFYHWSLLDNFEWNHGYGPKFGMVSVDPATFERRPKPSARWLGGIARANAL
jgi:beta-glucosidase